MFLSFRLEALLVRLFLTPVNFIIRTKLFKLKRLNILYFLRLDFAT